MIISNKYPFFYIKKWLRFVVEPLIYVLSFGVSLFISLLMCRACLFSA